MLTYRNYSSHFILKKLHFSACLLNENEITDIDFPKDLQKLRVF